MLEIEISRQLKSGAAAFAKQRRLKLDKEVLAQFAIYANRAAEDIVRTPPESHDSRTRAALLSFEYLIDVMQQTTTSGGGRLEFAPVAVNMEILDRARALVCPLFPFC